MTCENTATFLHPEQLETIGRKSGWPVAMEVKTTLAEGWKEEEETVTGEERIDRVRASGRTGARSTAAVRYQAQPLVSWPAAGVRPPGYLLSSEVSFCFR